ncbi:MAG: hypothetical protein WCP28_19615, partial [Actinomycetes bacterium]
MSEATPPTPMNPPSAVPPPDPLSAPDAPRSTTTAAPTPAAPGASTILGPDTKWILITICAVVAMLLLLGAVAAVAVVASHAVGNRMTNRGSMGNGPIVPGAPGQRQQPRGGGMGGWGSGGWGSGGRGTGGLGTGDWMTRLLPGLEHGDVVLQGPAGTPVTKRVVVGTITASTPTSVTIKA